MRDPYALIRPQGYPNWDDMRQCWVYSDGTLLSHLEWMSTNVNWIILGEPK